MTKRLSSCTADSTVLANPFNVASPMPCTPASVSTRVKTQFFHGLPTMKVVTSVIFIQLTQSPATTFLSHAVARLQINCDGSQLQPMNLARRCRVPILG